MERSLVILKPDAVRRRLIGRIISRFEEKGFRIAAMKLMQIPLEMAERNYAVHQGRPFYDGLLKFMTSGPVVLMVVEAPRAIEVTRKMMGATFGMNAEPGTLRGDFSIAKTFNLIHGSDSAESAEREISIFFSPDEIGSVELPGEELIFDPKTE